MNVENHRKKHDKVEKLEKDLYNFDIKLLPKKINNCGVDFKIYSERKEFAIDATNQIMKNLNKSIFKLLKIDFYKTLLALDRELQHCCY